MSDDDGYYGDNYDPFSGGRYNRRQASSMMPMLSVEDPNVNANMWDDNNSSQGAPPPQKDPQGQENVGGRRQGRRGGGSNNS